MFETVFSYKVRQRGEKSVSGLENTLELPARFVYYILVKLEALRFFVKTLKTKTLRANSEERMTP